MVKNNSCYSDCHRQKKKYFKIIYKSYYGNNNNLFIFFSFSFLFNKKYQKAHQAVHFQSMCEYVKLETWKHLQWFGTLHPYNRKVIKCSYLAFLKIGISWNNNVRLPRQKFIHKINEITYLYQNI